MAEFEHLNVVNDDNNVSVIIDGMNGTIIAGGFHSGSDGNLIIKNSNNKITFSIDGRSGSLYINGVNLMDYIMKLENRIEQLEEKQ